MCPEEGLCSHALPSNSSYNGEGSRARNGQNEKLERQDQSGNRAEENGNVEGHDLNGHANNQPNVEESTSDVSDVTMDTVFQDKLSFVETTHTPVENKAESDEAIVSMLDYLINLWATNQNWYIFRYSRFNSPQRWHVTKLYSANFLSLSF